MRFGHSRQKLIPCSLGEQNKDVLDATSGKMVSTRTQNKCLGLFELPELERLTMIPPDFTIHGTLIKIGIAPFDLAVLFDLDDHTSEVSVFDLAVVKV